MKQNKHYIMIMLLIVLMILLLNACVKNNDYSLIEDTQTDVLFEDSDTDNTQNDTSTEAVDEKGTQAEDESEWTYEY